LPIVTIGNQLAHIERADGCQGLVRRLRDRRADAQAELAAISLLVETPPEVRVECKPTIVVGDRARQPDFRIAEADEWLYVEVTQPRRSAAEETLQQGMHELAGLVNSIEGSYATEVFFNKPSTTADELQSIRPVVEAVCRSGVTTERALPNDLGVVYVGESLPGTIVLRDHGHPYVPRLGIARVIGGATAPRHVAVRVPFFGAFRHQCGQGEPLIPRLSGTFPG
jgi:hypothetical protein